MKTTLPLSRSPSRFFNASVDSPERNSTVTLSSKAATSLRNRASHSRSHAVVPVTSTRWRADGCQRSASSTVPGKSTSTGTPITSAGNGGWLRSKVVGTDWKITGTPGKTSARC